MLGVRRGTVKSRTARALERLRGRWSRERARAARSSRSGASSTCPRRRTSRRACSRARARPPRPARRRLVLALAVVRVAALLATLAIPDARSALARFLQIGGDASSSSTSFPRSRRASGARSRARARRARLARGGATAGGLRPARARRRAGRASTSADAARSGSSTGRPDAVRLLVAQTPKLDDRRAVHPQEARRRGHERRARVGARAAARTS